MLKQRVYFLVLLLGFFMSGDCRLMDADVETVTFASRSPLLTKLTKLTIIPTPKTTLTPLTKSKPNKYTSNITPQTTKLGNADVSLNPNTTNNILAHTPTKTPKPTTTTPHTKNNTALSTKTHTINFIVLSNVT